VIEESEKRAPTLWHTVSSVAAAFFGVQSSKNRQRDFTSGKPIHYIIIGVAMTGLFVVTIVTVVKLILRNAGL
jgi:hypothetical protein